MFNEENKKYNGMCRDTKVALEKDTPVWQTRCKYIPIHSASAPASDGLSHRCILLCHSVVCVIALFLFNVSTVVRVDT